MKIKGNTTWKPAAAKRPMLTNGLSGPQLGQWQPVLISAARWLLPWLAVSAGVALTSNVAKNALPEVPINKKNIALASALMGAGATSYFISEGISDQYKPWAYAAAVAGIASGLYYLFQEPSPESAPEIIPSKTVPPNQQVPAWSPSQMLEAFTVYVDPDQPNTGGTRRWPTSDQNYEVVVKNESSKPLTFFVGAEVYGVGSKRLYRSPDSKDPKYGRKKVTLAPTGQPGNDTRVILTVPPIEGTWWQSGYGEGIAVDFEFFRQGDDTAPFKVSESIPIHYTLWPVG
jgi:hypothetical protein